MLQNRGDVEALSFSQLIAGAKLNLGVLVINEGKFSPVHFHPCFLHLADGLQHVIVRLTCQLGNFERRDCLYLIYIYSLVSTKK